jgi:hypothetical protein
MGPRAEVDGNARSGADSRRLLGHSNRGGQNGVEWGVHQSTIPLKPLEGRLDLAKGNVVVLRISA